MFRSVIALSVGLARFEFRFADDQRSRRACTGPEAIRSSERGRAGRAESPAETLRIRGGDRSENRNPPIVFVRSPFVSDSQWVVAVSTQKSRADKSDPRHSSTLLDLVKRYRTLWIEGRVYVATFVLSSPNKKH